MGLHAPSATSPQSALSAQLATIAPATTAHAVLSAEKEHSIPELLTTKVAH